MTEKMELKKNPQIVQPRNQTRQIEEDKHTSKI